MMQRSGYSDVSGDKNTLLHRLQTGIPTLQFRIDGRECLQRALVVCLDAWGYDDAHMFQATMPNRGDCPWGKKRLASAIWTVSWIWISGSTTALFLLVTLNKQEKSGLPAN